MTIREWIVTIGVIGLVIERIIRLISRFVKPEKEIDKIAMDMVKLHAKSVTEGWDSTPLALFYLYKTGLKKQGQRYNEEFVEFLQEKEIKITELLEECEISLNRNFAVILELVSVLSELEERDKLPAELKDFLPKAQHLVIKNRGLLVEPRESKVKEIIAKIFRKKK